MNISPKFALVALLALDVFGNHAHVTEWALRTGINGAADIGHTIAVTVRDKVDSWTTDSPRHVIHTHPRPDS